VARRALTAGEPGKRMAKRVDVREEGEASKWARLAALSCWTTGHV
jgi:hypothetical protein